MRLTYENRNDSFCDPRYGIQKQAKKLTRLVVSWFVVCFLLCLTNFVLLSLRSQHMSQVQLLHLEQSVHIYTFMFDTLSFSLCTFSLLFIFTLCCIFIFTHNLLAEEFLTLDCNNRPVFTELNRKRSQAVRVTWCYRTHSVISTKTIDLGLLFVQYQAHWLKGQKLSL